MQFRYTTARNPPELEPTETYERLRGRIYTPRWGHEDSYDLTRTDKGWMTHRRGPIDNLASKDGSPAWYGELANDSITWDQGAPGFMERLWDDLDNQRISPGEAQEAFELYCGYLSAMNHMENHAFANSPSDWTEEEKEELSRLYGKPRVPA